MDGERVVVEIARRGKLVVGEPYFEFATPIVLDAKGLGEAKEGDLVEVRAGRGRPRVERLIGPASNVECVLEALLVERGLREPHEPHDPPAPSTEGRVDLRDLTTFTVDPETAKDFDDAISIRREDGGVRVWVHIADVAYFVPAGTPLDRGAARRGFTTYVPGRAAPMLPPELADDLCSLRPHVDRLTVTVEMPPGDAEPQFYRSVIRSDARLTYAQVERGDVPENVRAEVELADEHTREIRRRRFERGALRIETPEVNFAFDGRGGVERAWLEQEPEAHRLIEELMVLANECVARFLSSRQREALYRVHERPEPQSVALLLAKLEALDVPTPPAPEEMGPADAARIAGAVSESVMQYVRRTGRGREAFPGLVLRALKQARYDPRNLGHSGLASRAYCHFTSPIRRYPDLVVHRALLEELGIGDGAVPDDLSALAEHTSFVERDAAKVEYLADAICLAWLLEQELFERGWEHVWKGEIIGVIGSGIFVRFGEVFEAYLPARLLPGDYFEIDALGTQLVGRRGGGRFRLGDEIQVRVEEIRRTEGKVEVSLAGNPRDRR
jgi:ribonuclease R